MKTSLRGLMPYCALVLTSHAAVTVSDPSTAWTPLTGNYDFLEDHQTGKKSGDIVGIGSDYGFFVTFNDNGSASQTDGTLGFRLRLDDAGGSAKKPAFDRVAWIGIDANLDGGIDVFLGLNLQGSSEEIGIFSPGTGSNSSPNTTTIASQAYRTYDLTAENYNYRPVDYLTDGGTTNDLTSDSSGDPDYYVSFMVPFTDVVAFLAGRSIEITDQSPLRYVSATSTQTNKINQDLGGVNGGLDSGETWVAQGIISEALNAHGISVIPEPSAFMFAAAALALGLTGRRR